MCNAMIVNYNGIKNRQTEGLSLFRNSVGLNGSAAPHAHLAFACTLAYFFD
jgi:hypothetical protein